MSRTPTGQHSTEPKLTPGDLVHGQYEVLGCLAHGGLGWIYLARDHAVSNRYVVLKGVLDAGDAEATAAAMAERQFLAEVAHPGIVKIHNFVWHRARDSDVVDGYIVMEYVSGHSLKDLVTKRREQTGGTGCLPLEQAMSYMIEALRPLGYLHRTGLLFCDFKPDNVIVAPEQLKLIDLGAVRRRDDRSPAVYGTVGYQAPEIRTTGPSPASDLYAVGRTLAVLTFPFDFKHRYAECLPGPDEVPLLAEAESFHRLLWRATATDPLRRFRSAEQMAEQLGGVLREVAAARDGSPKPAPSTEFTPERPGFVAEPVIRPIAPDLRLVVDALPLPHVDSADPAAAFLATVGGEDPAELIEQLSAAPEPTVELCLRLIRAQIALGDIDDAVNNIEEVIAWHGDRPVGWRVQWYRGLAMLAANEAAAAYQAFDAVVDVVPGELAPKLALAACAEIDGDLATATRYYRLVWRTDHSFISAAFGLARTLLATGDRDGAVRVLDDVPTTSIHSVSARLAGVRIRIASGEHGEPSDDDLAEAERQLAGVELDEASRAAISSEVFEAALRRECRLDHAPSGRRVLGCPLAEPDLRRALERCYRTLARHTDDLDRRIELVNKANTVRPRTWL